VGGGSTKGKGDEENIMDESCMKPVEIILRKGEGMEEGE
jgi:hypothetical protein